MEFYSNIIHFGAVSYARDKDTSKSLLHPALALLPFVFRRKGNGIAKYISSLCPIKTCLFLNFYIQTKPLKSVLYSHQQKKKKTKPHQRFFKHSPKPVHTHCQGPAHYFRGPNPPARWGARKRSRRTATTTLAWPPTCHPHRRASRRPVQRSRAESRQTHPHRRRSLIGSSHTHEPSLRAARCIYPRAQARVRAGRLHHFSQLDPRHRRPGRKSMGRAPCCEKVGLRRGRWTKEEDEKLARYIRENGEGAWRSMPKNAGLLRCGKSCRLRWINYLRADLKRGNISPQEEDIILNLHATLGNR